MTSLSFDVPSFRTHRPVRAALKFIKDDPFDDGDRELITKLMADYDFDASEVAAKWGVHVRTLRAYMGWDK